MKNKKKLLYGMRWKLFFYVASIMISILLLVGFCVNAVMQRYLKDNAIEKYHLSSILLNQCLEEQFSKYDTATENFAFHDIVQKMLTKDELSYLETSKISSAWLKISTNDVIDAAFIDNKGNLYLKNNKKPTSVFDQQAYRSSILYQAADKTYASSAWCFMKDTIFKTNQEYIFLHRNIRNLNNPKEKGKLVISMSPNFIEKAMKKANVDMDLNYYLFNQDGSLFYQKLPKENKEKRIQKEEWITKITFGKQDGISIIETKDGILFSGYEPNSGLTIVTEAPDYIIYEGARIVKRIILILTVVSLVLVMGLCMLFSYYYTKPIYLIKSIMEKFDGTNFEERLYLSTNTELDIIGSSFNDMLIRMSQLVSKIKWQEREMRSLEMETLLYQINPHFLYNTLDNIYMLARIVGEQEIMLMIESLSTMLKISLNKGNELVSVKQELAHVESFIQIQKIRFGELFQYEILCNNNVKELKIIKLILQPIVENSIKYGFADLNSQGFIRIEVFQEKDNKIVFKIFNNGTSIAVSKAKELNQMDQMQEEEMKTQFITEEGGFGLYNVVMRLKIQYGELFKIHYEAVEAGGTICMLCIPILNANLLAETM